jgi:FixJ family two-component response regulator
VSSQTPDAPIVFIVDDDISIREALELLIRRAGWRPQTFATARDFLASPRSAVPCCLVLDVRLPDLSGLELQDCLGSDRRLPIIFITGYADVPTSVRAMKAGAVEFLEKPFGHDVLLSVLRQAIERSKTAIRDDADVRALRMAYATLTRREREVMKLVVRGQKNKQVGAKLGISIVTVKVHRGHLMRKMKADSLAELVRQADRLQITMTNI